MKSGFAARFRTFRRPRAAPTALLVDFGENIGNQITDAINRSAQKTAKSDDAAASDIERKREELETKRQAFEARREVFEQKQDALEALRDAHDDDLSEDAEAHLDAMEAELDQEEAHLDKMEDELDQLEDELEALEEDDEEDDNEDDDDDDDDDDDAPADDGQKNASDAGSGLNNLTIDQVIQMAPFMTRAKLDEIAYSLLKDNANFNQLVRLAPFLSRDTLSRIAEGVLLSPANKKNIAALAPFLGNDQLYRLLLNNLDCLDWELMKRVAPFLKRSMVDSLMTYLTTGTKPVYESKPEKTASGCFTETIQQFASDLGSIAGDLIDYGKRASEPFRQKAAAPASAETPKPSDAPKPAEAPKPRQTAKAPSEMRDKVARTALNAGNWDWLSANLDAIGDRLAGARNRHAGHKAARGSFRAGMPRRAAARFRAAGSPLPHHSRRERVGYRHRPEIRRRRIHRRPDHQPRRQCRRIPPRGSLPRHRGLRAADEPLPSGTDHRKGAGRGKLAADQRPHRGFLISPPA